MNAHILYKNGEMEVIAGIEKQKRVDGSTVILTLADDSEKTIQNLYGIQFLSDEELAQGYKFSEPTEEWLQHAKAGTLDQWREESRKEIMKRLDQRS